MNREPFDRRRHVLSKEAAAIMGACHNLSKLVKDGLIQPAGMMGPGPRRKRYFLRAEVEALRDTVRELLAEKLVTVALRALARRAGDGRITLGCTGGQGAVFGAPPGGPARRVTR